MIRYASGNILDAQAEALVNTVNEVGVMGKGVALAFRDAFPDNTRAYEAACRAGEVRVGRMFVTANPSLVCPRWIINFPTKRHWRHPSRMDWIREGLTDLVRVVRERRIASVALPPLGCGSGGLLWTHVRREIEAAAALIPDVDVIAFEPSDSYEGKPKAEARAPLTPARALIADLVRRYCAMGMDCSVLEVQKLAWFLHRAVAQAALPDPLHLEFVPHRYGPYADKLRHLLDALDGGYLHCERRLGDARPYDLIWFDDARIEQLEAYLRAEPALTYSEVLHRTMETVAGFETPLGLELLATVDWLLASGTAPTVEALRGAMERWPGGRGSGPRKARLFDDRLISLALKRLADRVGS